MTTSSKLMQAALVYASWGWAVHPLHSITPDGSCSCGKPGCSGPGKHPRLFKWTEKATTDPVTIRRWWEQWPEANIGLACGPSGFLAVDLDVKGGTDGLAAWTDLGVQHDPTPTSNTPSGGQHILFSANGAGLRCSAGRLGAGIDTRGDGGYIVLPPSKLEDGRKWEWVPDVHPSKCKPVPLPGIVRQALSTNGDSAERPVKAPSSTSPASADRYALAAFQGELGKLAVAAEGTRNATLNTAAFSLGQLVGAGLLDRAEVESRLLSVATTTGLSEREALTTIGSGLTAGEKQPRHVSDREAVATERPATESGHAEGQLGTTAPAAIPDPYNLTDLGNSERLAAWHGDDLRYCNPWGSWLAWDGKRWRRDDTREVERRANETVRAAQKAALDMPTQEQRAEHGKWAFKSESEHRRRAMINGARALLPILPEDLDGDPWLLTAKNGTVDLRTGELQPHRKRQMITKLAPVDYDPNAQAPTWESFLDRIMAGNRDLIDFLRQAVGYSLTGDTREQCLFFLYGTGANGKSTFLEALTDMLDEYAHKTPTETLLISRAGGVPNDVARLKGARLVTAVEAEENQRLAESLVKQMTGGDTIAARFLHREWFEFVPGFKLWLATNHKPQIRGTDNAIWRRIRLVPFTVTIPDDEQDKTLGQKLATELPGILAWAVRGCLEWQRDGLRTPRDVRRATADYQAEMDVLAGFVEDCCLVKLTAKATAKALYEAYCEWCDVNGEKPVAKRTFGLRLRERGYTQGRTGQGRFWEGIGLLSEPEQLDLMDPDQGREVVAF